MRTRQVMWWDPPGRYPADTLSPSIDVCMVEMEGYSSDMAIETQLSNRVLTSGPSPKGPLRPLVSGRPHAVLAAAPPVFSGAG